jgi:hypothetical protein
MISSIVLHDIAIQMAKGFNIPHEIKSSILCTTFIRNNGALILTRNQRLTNRRKYFHINWHHFWDVLKSGDIKIIKVDAAAKQADCLTKGLICERSECWSKDAEYALS